MEYRRIIPVSTGRAALPTPAGDFQIGRVVDSMGYSAKYENAPMWRSLYFEGGDAIHGEVNDSDVLPYFASHGCVRTFTRDQNLLWADGFEWGGGW